MSSIPKEKLWEEYLVRPTPKLREQIIIEYSQLVKIVAGRLSIYLGYNVEYDDLVSYGIFGLIDAIDKFDAGKEVKFETYASLRIRGAILDQIRKMDWIPRTVRQKQRKIEDAIKAVESRTGNVASDEEIAAELGISTDEYNNWQGQLKVTNVISLNEYVESGAAEPVADSYGKSHYVQPEEAIEKEELSKKLKESLETLTDKEKSVILMYYYDDMSLKEIAAALSVTESRVSQLHTKALQKMRKIMGPYMNILTDRV